MALQPVHAERNAPHLLHPPCRSTPVIMANAKAHASSRHCGTERKSNHQRSTNISLPGQHALTSHVFYVLSSYLKSSRNICPYLESRSALPPLFPQSFVRGLKYTIQGDPSCPDIRPSSTCVRWSHTVGVCHFPNIGALQQIVAQFFVAATLSRRSSISHHRQSA